MNELTQRIIACAIAVHRALGPGLLESASLQCLVIELRKAGLEVFCDVELPIVYCGVRVDCAVATILPVHEAQLLTYLRLTGKPIGLLLNFNVTLMKDGIVRLINTPETR